MSSSAKSDGAATCRLYLISPPEVDLTTFPQALEAALGAGDVACFQLRLKSATDDQVTAAAKTLMPLAHQHEVAFIINDRPDLAAQLGADGTHVGQDDTPYKSARAAVGDEAIVGVTCHDSRHLAMLAGENGADYVAFGAFYDTSTKHAKTRADVDILSWWQQMMEVPCVAIGGITVETIGAISKAGADFAALSSGVWQHPDGPAAAIAALNAELAAHPHPFDNAG